MQELVKGKLFVEEQKSILRVYDTQKNVIAHFTPAGLQSFLSGDFALFSNGHVVDMNIEPRENVFLTDNLFAFAYAY